MKSVFEQLTSIVHSECALVGVAKRNENIASTFKLVRFVFNIMGDKIVISCFAADG